MNKLLISHRGNLRGPNPDYENNPEHIVKNVLPNFDCEVDLRFDSHNNTFYLGHDFNQYEIDFSFYLGLCTSVTQWLSHGSP